MPPWEQRLVSITARWPGFSVSNAKDKCVLRYRVSGESPQQVTLPPPLLYREADEPDLISWCRAIYKHWDGGTTRGNRLRSTSSGLYRQAVARSLLGYELRLNKGGAGQQQMQQQQ